MEKNFDPRLFLEYVDARISKWQEIREFIAEECHLTNGKPTPKSAEHRNRKEQLLDLLRTRGPLARKDLLEATGMPIGTVSYVLNDKKMFKHLADGRWDLVEKK